ncbi:MAG: thioredoxin domain-containing protein [Acidimicrobiia bacterium]
MNRLAHETSPYLRQHQDNPVDWWPWGDEAFAEAKRRDVPVLLSVGYSACHWCHVMAHESFEDSFTGAVMNKLFVSIKVDREERPDVDAVYMTAVQSMTGRGGWPMTVFLTPEGQPFYAGTYYPKEDRHGLPGFVKVLQGVSDAWGQRRAEVVDHAATLTDAIAKATTLAGVPDGAGSALPGAEVLDKAVATLASSFDARFGGFGAAPKFPAAMSLDLLLRAHLRTGDPRALTMATTTLDAMAAGGMYDQVGGGFHRYSVDAFWLVPHFEKMLYDQATLVRVYLHAYQVTGEARYRTVVEETVGYVLRDLASPAGGFCSAEDADSEGEEGRFYVWSLDEVAEVAGDDLDEAVRYWGITKGGNFEGANILHVRGRTEPRPPAVETVRAALFTRRESRVRPGLDDKVLLGWNAMFCGGLAEAAAALGRGDWMEAARANARFLLGELRRPDGRLLRSWQAEAGGRHLACGEDYAALAGALVTMAEVDDTAWLGPAREVADGLLSLFSAGDGSFFITGEDAPALVARPKDLFDGPTPSATSLGANALLRLGALTGDERYRAAGEAAVGAAGPLIGEHPGAFADLAGAFERMVAAPVEVAVVGPPDDPGTVALAGEVRRRYLPNLVAVCAAPGTGAEWTPLLADRPLADGQPAAYLCERFACRAPITDPSALGAALDAIGVGSDAI